MKKSNILPPAVCPTSMFGAANRAETMKTRIGGLQFTSGYPTGETAQKIYDELDLRAVPQTRDDFPKLVERMHTYRQYKLSEAKEPPRMTFISLSGKETDMLTHEGFAYFESLARYIDANPPRAQDMAMLGILETLGIA